MLTDAVAIAQECLLVGVEGGIDRIDGDNGREQRRFALAAGDQIAARDERPADAAVDRRDDPGEFEVELGGPQRGGDGVDMRRRLGGDAGAALALFERHGVVGRQAIGALHFGGGAIARGGRLRELGAQPFHLGQERAIVELEQQLSLPYEAAFLEGDVRERPETRGRTPTDCTGSRRPVNSSHSVTSRAIAARGGDLRQRGRGAGLDAGATAAKGRGPGGVRPRRRRGASSDEEERENRFDMP